MPAFTNTASWRVKCISSFFFTFTVVSSNCSAPRFSSIFTGYRFWSSRCARACPTVSALVMPSTDDPLASMAA